MVHWRDAWPHCLLDIMKILSKILDVMITPFFYYFWGSPHELWGEVDETSEKFQRRMKIGDWINYVVITAAFLYGFFIAFTAP